MSKLLYRESQPSDIAAMAEIRAADWGTREHWKKRISQYLSHEHRPQHALRSRVCYVCVDREAVAGLIAGHLTRRYGCAGELEWISIRQEYRRRGVASELLRHLSSWFATHDALQVCVDVDPSNVAARKFYRHHGAQDLKPHWMVWKDIRIVTNVEG